MLTALNQDGQLITLQGEARNSAIRLRKQKKFYCPICKEPLMLKAGPVKIPHFSHRHRSQCTGAASEPESPRHLKGKLDLFEWCKISRLDASLELYLPDIKQRPDLLVKSGGKQYAIEFQCTPISVQTVEKRSMRYLLSGIKPIWIVGGPPFHKRKTREIFELTEYHWALSIKVNDQTMLAGYEPENGLVSLITHISSFSSRKIFSKYHQMPLTDVKFPLKAFGARPPFPMQRWLNEKNNWIQQKVRHGDLIQDRFLKAVYMAGSNPFLFNPLIGLPVNYMESFVSHPVEWQFFIWTDCLKKLRLNKNISLKYVNFKLRNRLCNGDLVCRILPLHGDSPWEEAVRHYFQLLERLFYFQKVGKDLYKMIQAFPSPVNVEEVQQKEKEIFVTLMNNKF